MSRHARDHSLDLEGAYTQAIEHLLSDGGSRPLLAVVFDVSASHTRRWQLALAAGGAI
jgi:hypothetical protein